jgi:hypothetical protein
MRHLTLWVCAVCISAAAAGCSEDPVTASEGKAAPPDVLASVSAATWCPSGWSPALIGKAVILCKRTVTRGGGAKVTDYVQVIDLSRGARVVSLASPRSTASPGNPSPSFSRLSVRGWWDQMSRSNRFCAVTGAFFGGNPLGTGSRNLSFPLKHGGTLLTTGELPLTPASSKDMLILNGSYAQIRAYSLGSVSYSSVRSYLSSYGTAVVTYAPGGSAPNTRDSRTYAGTRDADGNGRHEILMFYTSAHASPNEAAGTLISSFGASRTTQFDGGGSTQLVCKGTSFVSNTRSVPHAFGIYED